MLVRAINVVKFFKAILTLLFLFFLANWYFEYYNDSIDIKKVKNEHNSSKNQKGKITQHHHLPTISDVLKHKKKQIAKEMRNYPYPNGKFGVLARNLQELTLESGGTPMRSVIISTWRSGSSFLGELLNAMPGSMHHFEPLIYFDVQIRGPPNDKEALRTVEKLLNCNYTGLEKFFEDEIQQKLYLSRISTYLSNRELYSTFFQNPEFFEQFCKLFPLQSMKLVRLRTKVAASLLTTSSLNVRIILLIRDPRGVYQSRKRCKFCQTPDCYNISLACMDMVSDYQEAVKLRKDFPNTFKVVRYEDMSNAPYNTAREVLRFYGLPFEKFATKFLATHTKNKKGGDFATYRDTKTNAFKWTKTLPYNETKIVQDSCKEAMKLWGYKEANNDKELIEDFDPLLPFNDFD